MSYYLADTSGYLTDIASINGWAGFAQWGTTQVGPIRDFIQDAVTEDPIALADALERSVVPAESVSIAQDLMATARRADGLLILSDGVGNDD